MVDIQNPLYGMQGHHASELSLNFYEKQRKKQKLQKQNKTRIIKFIK